MAEQHPLKWRHVEAEIILLCVRWYLRDAVPLSRSGRDDAGEGPLR
jgi:transposase-like protein